MLLNRKFKLFKELFEIERNMATLTFDQLPSPPKLPIINHLYLFLPGGKYKFERLTEAVQDLSNKYGSIFKLNLGELNMVISTNPDDAEKLFRNEGKYPLRPPFPALACYRQKTYGAIGITPGNGEEWYKFRNGILPLLKTNLVQNYEEQFAHVADKFVEYIENTKTNENIVEDVFAHVLKFTIEGISVISPGRSFHCLEKDNKNAEAIIKASMDFMDGIYETLIGPPLWKIFRTSGYRKIESSHSFIHSILTQHLEALRMTYKQHGSLQNTQPFLDRLLQNKNLKWEDVVMLAMETFFGGIDATATTIAFTLHYLARNSHIQVKARADAKAADPKYLKACVKETLRLCPTGGANSRILINDLEFSGYLIPKGTLVSVFNSITASSEKYFENARSYTPDRWLRGEGSVCHPFASLPFGYGARMCPGRRVAELEIVTLLKRILLKYDLKSMDEYNIGMVYRMNRVPDRPINIKFINTNC